MSNCLKKSKNKSPQTTELPPPPQVRFFCEPKQKINNYVVESKLGYGAFGNVYKVSIDKKKQNKFYALKAIKNEKRFIKAAKTEAIILKHLLDNNVPNVCELFDSFSYEKHPCFVFNLYHKDLYTAITDHKKIYKRGFDHTFIKEVVKQIFVALDHLNKHFIVHADLKPENIMLESPGSNKIRIIDFGSSCLQNSSIHTYIQSRYYRSPEVLLGGVYGTQIDVWSLGCIIYELFTTKPLFRAKSSAQLLMMHTELLNLPTTSYFDKCQNAHEYYCYSNDNDGGKYVPLRTTDVYGVKRIPGTINIDILINQYMESQKIPYIKDGYFNDLIMQCISYPYNRITPIKALNHEYLKTKL